MATINIQSLEYVKTTNTQKVFKVKTENGDYITYFANIEKNDNVSTNRAVNKSGFTVNDEIYHDIYDQRKILFHHFAERRHQYPYEKNADYQHVYRCITNENNNLISNSFINVIQTQNTLYAIDNLSTYGHYYVNDEIYNYLCRDNEYAMPYPNKINTYIYPKVEALLSNNISDAIDIIYDIEYNTLYEIPGNTYTDYSKGSIFATTVKTKNQYNALYNMSHDNDYVLKNCRQYLEICNCNNQVYLKYTDNVNYKQSDNTTTEKSDADCYTNIQQIEVLKNINRGINIGKHKSTLYTIDIKNTKIFDDQQWISFNSDLTSKENIIANIKLEIKNTVRDIVRHLAPANTQLFAVTINNA